MTILRSLVASLPVVVKDHVWHVGAFDSQHRFSSSLEGPCLSVSVHPEEWSAIARIGGETWRMSRPGSRFVDVDAVDEEAEAGLESWAVEAGLAEPVTVWVVSFDDMDEDGEPSRGTFLYLDETKAREEAELTVQDSDDELDLDDVLSNRPGLALTEDGKAVLSRWGEETLTRDGLVILALLEAWKEAPGEGPVGAWMDDRYDPLNHSCPRGGIVPGAIDLFARELHPGPGAEDEDIDDLDLDDDPDDEPDEDEDLRP